MKKVCRKHTATGMVYFNDLKDLKKLENALVAYKRKFENLNEKQEEEVKNDSNLMHQAHENISINKKIKN